ncbi:MAG: aspartate aminotransferase family protein [Desulfobacterales bacterium]|nr:MAG: aspartate aminotransferase family protein [Desulfobacterales bacterium]
MSNSKEAILQELRNRTPKSGAYWEKAKDLVPGGLISGARKMEPYPVYVARGKGAYIWDIDGNRYIDCAMSFGVHVLGHGPEVVLKALHEQCELGMSYGMPHTREVEFTKRLIECVPCAELAMVCNTGTESTLLAWRLMRAASRKPKIAKFEGCYHGWHDYAQWNVFVDPKTMGPADRPHMTPGSAGIPEGAKNTMLVLPFSESAFRMIEEHAHELAGVAIEPVIGGGMLTVDRAFLQKLREVTRKAGVLLHYDEVITGFRLALGGCQELTGVLPDVATYGKIIGGGLPIGAVACSKEMVAIARKTDDGFSAAGTFSGNPLTLSTGAAMMQYLQENRHIYDDMMVKGEFLRSGFNEWTTSRGYPFCMTGIGSMFQIHAKADLPVVPRDLLGQDKEALAELQLHFRLNHVLLPWMHLAFFSAAHSQQDIEEVLRAFKAAVEGVMASKIMN